MTDELISKPDVVKIVKSVLSPASSLTNVARARRQMLNEINELESKPEIVRCKDCKYRYVEGDNVRYNTCELNHNNVQSDDWYCADAERREVTT